jgi:hypothetical protein
LWGTLDIGPEALAAYPAFLSELASASGVFYAVCDRESHRLEAMRAGPDLHGAPDRIEALESAYWYNYFGHEFRDQVPVAALESFARVERSPDGLAVLLADSPGAANVARMQESWPVFRSQSPTAAFRPPVGIAFDDVWRVPPVSLSPRSPSQVVGPADAFIATVADEAMRFRAWAQQQGLQGGSPHELREFLKKNSAVVLDEWLKPAIAAYGEAVRAEIAGEWSVSRMLHRGEPVVRRRSRPWTARRVVLEALETLSSET